MASRKGSSSAACPVVERCSFNRFPALSDSACFHCGPLAPRSLPVSQLLRAAPTPLADSPADYCFSASAGLPSRPRLSARASHVPECTFQPRRPLRPRRACCLLLNIAWAAVLASSPLKDWPLSLKRNEAQLGSLALRLGCSLCRALTKEIALLRHRLRCMFNVQFTWQTPFILLVHSGFHDAPKTQRREAAKKWRSLQLKLKLDDVSHWRILPWWSSLRHRRLPGVSGST